MVKDFGERIRCAHKSKKQFKPSFVQSYTRFDELSDMKIREYYESEPTCPPYDEDGNFLCDDEEVKKYERETDKFKNEKPSFVVKDICYAILSDEKTTLSLEKILDRLNLKSRHKVVYCSEYGSCQRLDELKEWERGYHFCQGHIEENDETVHSFSGWTLAWYVQKWYEQVPDGKAPVFEKYKER